MPVLLSAAVNFNVLANGFGWDDEIIIQNLRPPGQGLQSNRPDATSRQNTAYYRPVIELSYLLDHTLWGKQPFGYHLSVLIAHLLNTALVFFLAGAVLSLQPLRVAWPPSLSRQADRPAPVHARWIPFTAASLFAVHPAHAEAVAWIAGRNDVFCAVFLLAGLLFYLRFHADEQKFSEEWKSGRWIWYGMAVLFFALALLTKETAVGLLAVFPLIDYLTAPRSLTLPVLSRRILYRSILPLGIVLFYFIIRHLTITRPWGETSPALLADSSSAVKLIGALGLYLKTLLVPFPHHPFITSVPVSPPDLIFSVLMILVIIAGFFYLLRRRSALFSLPLVWTVVLLAPAVSVAVVQVAAIPAAERYAYAPSAGLMVLTAWLTGLGLDRLTELGWSSRKTWIAGGFALLMLLAFLGRESWIRNTVWKDSLAFWEAAVIDSPTAGFPHRELGKHYEAAGQPDRAEPAYRRAVDVYEETVGPEHPDLAESLYALATLYYGQGRYPEAEPLFQRALQIREKSLGPDHPRTADTLNNLGLLYYNLKRYDKAEPLFLRAVGSYEKVLGPDYSETALSMNNLAGLYFAQGRYAQAEPLYQRTLAVREKTLGPDHPDIAQSLNNLGVIYHQQKQHDKAESLYRRALAIREKALGPDHPDLTAGLNNLAGLYYVEGKYAEAEPLYRRALAIREKALKPDHPDLVTSLQNYAVLLRTMNRMVEAAELSARAEMIRKKRAP